MERLEQVCRIICIAEGVDPDRESVGSGGVIPRNQKYKLWEARRQPAEAILADEIRIENTIIKSIVEQLIAKAHDCDAEAKALGKPKGSTAHMRGNVWRAAAATVSPEMMKDVYGL